MADSIGWRRFTRIGIDGKVPRPTTLMKITTRCGSEVIEALNEALFAGLAEQAVYGAPARKLIADAIKALDTED